MKPPSTSAYEPPCSLESERAVLAGILLENAALKPCRELGLNGSAFYWDSHALVWDAYCELAAAGVPIDTVTVRDALATSRDATGVTALQRLGYPNGVRGDEWLLALTDTIPSLANITAHARIVLEKAARRRVRLLFQRGIKHAGEGVFDDALECAREALGVKVDEREVVLSLRDTMHLAVHAPRAQQASNGLRVRTGFPVLDHGYGHMRRSTMLVLGGRTGAGKSKLMLASALSMARAGLRPGIVSVEDSADIWGTRAYAQLIPELNADRLLSEQADFDLHAEAERGLRMAEGLGVSFVYKLNEPLQSVVNAVRWLCRTGHNVIFVDYLQAIRLGHGGGKTSRAELVSNAAQLLKATCQEHDAVLVLGSQLRRPDNAKPFAEPHASDLKESGDLENMAECVVLLWKSSDETDAKHLGKVAKVKWSPRRPRFLMQLGPNGRIEDIEVWNPPPADLGGWGRVPGKG